VNKHRESGKAKARTKVQVKVHDLTQLELEDASEDRSWPIRAADKDVYLLETHAWLA
jgi:hypothetical protein